MPPIRLPIFDAADQIADALRSGNRMVISAPTGSGKTTQVPQMLYRAGLSRVVVLQPRRLATRLMAIRVAQEMNSPIGSGLVGYQTRHDSAVSDANAIRFMTEGLFLRQVQADPQLPGIQAVVLDEFHERSVALDTALALVKGLQSRRPALRLVVMSATLDVQRVRAYLDCPAVETGGRLYPVDVRYLPKRSERPVWEQAASAVAGALAESDEGDVLVFMPGAYEIRRTVEACRVDADVVALHGEMPPHEQDAALAPRDRRKVIVATNVAETSITIPGVRYVIDSGLARVNRFDPRRGINVLLVEPISQASADQRAGRAGRTAPGTCVRLWTQFEHRTRPAQTTPEVQRLDLAQVLLQLKSLGVADPRQFDWLEAPDPQAVEHAQRVLEDLGAVASDGTLTRTGAAMARLPMHPRLARMLIAAAERGCLARASLWAALISERDILARDGWPRFARDMPDDAASDFLVLDRAFEAGRRVNFAPQRCADMGFNGAACREVERTARLYQDACRAAGLTDRPQPCDVDDLIRCVLAGYSDHLAVRRNPANLAVALTGKRRGTLDRDSVVKHADVILAVEVREIETAGGKVRGQRFPGFSRRDVDTIVSLASAIDPAWLADLFPQRMSSGRVTQWDPQKKAAVTVEQERFDDLVLRERALHETDRDAAAELIADMIARSEIKLDGWDEEVDRWIARVRWVRARFPERGLINYDEHDQRVLLLEICSGVVRQSQLADRPVLSIVRNALSWEDQQFVDRMAPAEIRLPSGRRMKIDYEMNTQANGANGAGLIARGRAKIQDLYGLDQTPRVAGGTHPVLLEVLGPNFRPLQVTDDLAGFWKNLYPTLRKELSRRYPRHEWR